MLAVSDMGAIVAPPVPAFYTRPDSVEEIVAQSVGRVLDLFELDSGQVRRWGEPADDDAPPLRAPRLPKAK